MFIVCKKTHLNANIPNTLYIKTIFNCINLKQPDFDLPIYFNAL